VRDMGGSLPDLQKWRTEIEAGRMAGPHIVASGPALDGDKNKLPDILAANTPAVARSAVITVKAMGADLVKILSGIPREAYFEIAKFSQEQKMSFAGHVPAEVSVAEASDAGQKSVEHLDGIQLACSEKEQEQRKALLEAVEKGDLTALDKLRPEILAAFSRKKCDALFARFKRNGTWQVPTQIWTRTVATIDKADSADPNLKFLPASLTSDWTAEKLAKQFSERTRSVYAQRFERGKEFVRMMNTAGVGLLAGSDSIDPYVFSGSSLHHELAIFVEEGLTPQQALQTSTRNPAQYFSRADIGTIETGKMADLVLLNADPLNDIHNTTKIDSVIFNGKFYSRANLDKLLEDARNAAAAYKP